MSLNKTDRDKFSHILEKIADLGQLIKPPIDPKVEGMLEITYAMIKEQLDEDRVYIWRSRPAEDDRWITGTEDIPDEDELNRWLDE